MLTITPYRYIYGFQSILVEPHNRKEDINLSHLVEEGEGFEPSELLHPLVFKTSAISQTLPTFHLLKELSPPLLEPVDGLEPPTC